MQKETDHVLGWVKKFRYEAEEVEIGEMEFLEFALLSLMQLKVDPRRGFFISNFSLMAKTYRLSSENVRYLCSRLLEKEKIYFEMTQGKKTARFYVLGLEILKGQIVDWEFIRRSESNKLPLVGNSARNSEVEASIPMSQSPVSSSPHPSCKLSKRDNSEVPYKETENETLKETNTENEPVKEIEKKREQGKEREQGEKGVVGKSLKGVSLETLQELVQAKGVDYLKDYLAKQGYDHLEINQVLKEIRL